MKILRTASLESNFIGSYKKKCIQCNKIECFATSCFAASNNWSSLKLNIYSNDMQWKIGDHGQPAWVIKISDTSFCTGKYFKCESHLYEWKVVCSPE